MSATQITAKRIPQTLSMRQPTMPVHLHVSITSPTILLFSLLVVLFNPGSPQENLTQYCIHTGGNYTESSAFPNNLNLVLSTLSSKARLTGFYNDTAGLGLDKVYGLYLCRGDVTSDVCEACVKAASKDVVEKCPNQKEVVIWYKHCILRYANRPIFSTPEYRPYTCFYSTYNASDPNRLKQILSKKLDGLISKAAFDPSTKMFAIGEANFTEFQTLYCLVQCTPDLSPSGCNTCLKSAISDFPNCCDGCESINELRPSCIVRYSVYPFYQLNEPAPAEPAPAPSHPPPTNTDNGMYI